MSRRTTLDVITAEIIRNGMTSAALEMARTLRRSAYNPLLFESQDYGFGVTSPTGELWGEAPGVAVFVGCLGDTIKTGIERLGLDGFHDGDVILVNDPYLSGTHISDTTVYVPVFHEDELVAFCSATAHWADVGGKEPGGWCPDSTSIFQEGVCFTHLKLVAAGERNEALFELIRANVRYPDMVIGDLEAMLAATRQGAARVRSLCARYGAEVVGSSMALVIQRTDAAVRREILAIPNGTYRASTALDSDGVVVDDPVRLAVTIRIEGDGMTASFDGTSGTRRGPVNLNPIAAKSAVRIALKALTMATDATNEGHFRALEFDIEPGGALTAEHPAPCDSYGYAVTAVVEIVVRALSQAMPERCPAGGSQLAGVVVSRSSPADGDPFILNDALDCGTGGRPDRDGAVLNVMGNGDIPTTPVEVVENRYPVRVERYAYLPEVAGAGRHRGGLGVRRDYRILEPGMQLNVMLENTRDLIGAGAHGGQPGKPARIVVHPDSDREVALTRHRNAHPLQVGDTFSARTSGGGGFGDPLDRDPAAVLRDVREDLLCTTNAEAIYGVRLVREGESWRVDDDATRTLRQARARSAHEATR